MRHRLRREFSGCPEGRLLLQPVQPGAVHVILDNAGLIGINTVDSEVNRSVAGTKRPPREVAAEP